MKKVLIGLGLVVLVLLGYWLISPLFIEIEADDASPLDVQIIEENVQSQQDLDESSQVEVDSTIEAGATGSEATGTSDADQQGSDGEGKDSIDEGSAKEDLEKIEPKEEMKEPMPSQAIVIRQGNFVDAPSHDATGKVLVIEQGDKRVLRFEDFQTDNGPDLKIYLATDTTADDFVDLGALKATKGNVNYEFGREIDLEKYDTVLIWCRAFSVLFGSAELK